MTRIGSDEDDDGDDAELSNEELQDTAVSHDYDSFAAAQMLEEGSAAAADVEAVPLQEAATEHESTGLFCKLHAISVMYTYHCIFCWDCKKIFICVQCRW